MYSPSSTPNQIRSIPSFSATGASSGTTMKAELEVVEEEGQQEDADDQTRKPFLAAGQVAQQVLDPQVALDAVEGQREDPRADQDHHHEGGQPGGALHGLLEQLHVDAPAHDRQRQRAAGPHGTAFGRRGDAQEDGARRQEDDDSGGISVVTTRSSSLAPCSVRASGGNAGTLAGLKTATSAT